MQHGFKSWEGQFFAINILSSLDKYKRKKKGSSLPVLRTILVVFRPALIFHSLVIATNIPFHWKHSKATKNCYEIPTFYLLKNKQHFRGICNKYFQINWRSWIFSGELQEIKIHLNLNKYNKLHNADNLQSNSYLIKIYFNLFLSLYEYKR